MDCEPRHTANEPHRTAFHVAASTVHEGMAPPEKQETDMTNLNELSFDELDKVSGGRPSHLPPRLAEAFAKRALEASLEAQFHALQSFKIPNFF